MQDMRKFGKTFRLSADSHEDIAAEFIDSAGKLGRSGLKFQRYKLRPGPLLNAIALAFLKMSDEERQRYACEALAKLESFLAEPETACANGAAAHGLLAAPTLREMTRGEYPSREKKSSKSDKVSDHKRSDRKGPPRRGR